MKFDDIDISILFYLLDNPNKTTTDIAKKIFECDISEIRKKDALVRLRLKEMEQKQFVISSPKSPKTYSINPSRVCNGKGTLNIKANGGGILHIDFGDFLVITDNKKYVHIYRIERENSN